MRIVAPILAVLMLSGCSILSPGKKEFFQKSVPVYPEQTFKDLEPLRQAAALAKETAAETYLAANKENASPFVVTPARDAVILSDAVSTSLGPPLKPSRDSAEETALAALMASAEHNRDLDKLKGKLQPLEGKDVEGTGLIQVGYFTWIGIIGALFFAAYLILKTIVNVAAAANPGIAVGSAAASSLFNIGGRVATKGFKQLMVGGEKFKALIERELEPAVAEKVKGLFRTAHTGTQDEDVQTAVKVVTGTLKDR